jgi:hypothetical protein
MNEGLLVGFRHALWNQYDDGLAFAVSGHRTRTTTAPAHFNPRARFGSRWWRAFARARAAAPATLPPWCSWLRQRQSWLIHDPPLDGTSQPTCRRIGWRASSARFPDGLGSSRPCRAAANGSRTRHPSEAFVKPQSALQTSLYIARLITSDHRHHRFPHRFHRPVIG